MKMHLKMITHQSVFTLAAGLAAAVLLCAGANVGHAQLILPSGVQDVVKLAQAGMSDDIILSQVKNTGAVYNLTADQIIFLKNQHVSETVIKALMTGTGTPAPAIAPAPMAPPVSYPAPAPAPAPVVTVAPAPVVEVAAPAPTLEVFQAQLAPYGAWIPVPGYGLCWEPTATIADPFWRPYLNQGHWIYTDAGWSWQSDYSWGAIPFHYGRWTLFNAHWVWVPGYDWAPAWVCWRQADDSCGWAPLPPGATFTAGVGLSFNGHLAVDVDFGLGVDAFTFVGYDHFWDYNLHPFLLPRDRMEFAFRGSHIMNGYRMDHGRFIIEGLGHEHMGAFTHHEIRIERDRHDPHFQGHGGFDNHGGHDVRGGHDDHGEHGGPDQHR
jgi:hypothetical protein